MRLDARLSAAARVRKADVAARAPCLECGGPMDGRHARAEFCGPPCRKAWNNRRMVRGAELYDLFMAHRFDRARATELGLLGVVNRMASYFRDDDKAARDGRRSWRRPEAVLESRPGLRATVFYLRKGKRR